MAKDQNTDATTNTDLPVNAAQDARDDVRAAIEQVRAQGADEDGAPQRAEAGDQPNPLGDQTQRTDGKTVARDTGGKFKTAAKTNSAATAQGATGEQKQPPLDDSAKASALAPKPDDAPPAGWVAEGKSAWSALQAALHSLPPDVQASVSAIQKAAVKREADYQTGAQQWSETKQRYEATLRPLVQETSRLGIEPGEGLQRLLAAHHMLNTNAPAAIVRLAQQFGVDLQQLATNPPAFHEPDPNVAALQRSFDDRFQGIEGFVKNFLTTQTLGVVDEFASKNPHYEAVEEDVFRILPRVKQENPGLLPAAQLQMAYDQAIWLNPEVRERLIQEKATGTRNATIEQVQRKQEQANRAAVSTRGASSGGAAARQAPPAGDNDDHYAAARAAIQELRAG